MAFPENLQFLRTQKDITQEQLAEQLNVSRQSVSKWESGTSFPEMDTLLRICDLYTVNLDTLLRGSVEESFVQDISHYDAFMNRFSLCVTCAVGAIMASLAALCVMDGFGVNEMLSAAFFMLVVTVSVVALIAIGIEDDHFRKKHPIIQFDTIYEKGTYEIMYVFRSKVYSEAEVVFKYYQFIECYSEQEFDSYMKEMAAMSLYDTGVTAKYGDRLLTLSTCDSSEENGRFVVVAKRVEE